MFKLNFLTLLAAFAFLFSGCGNNANSGQQEEDPMAPLTEERGFVEAHEKPDSITFTPRGEMISFSTPDGQTGSAYALTTSEPSKKFLLVIHEWWGLNDQIKQESERLFDELADVNVLALDLYDGKVTANPDEAAQFMQATKPDRSEAIVKGAISHAGDGAKIGTIGWCFGGGWSLRSSIIAAKQGIGCVMYYGMPVQTKEEVAPLKAEVLGLFASQDAFITPEIANNFEKMARSAGKKVEIFQFEANHAFANPSSPAYSEREAQEANRMALTFLKDKFGKI